MKRIVKLWATFAVLTPTVALTSTVVSCGDLVKIPKQPKTSIAAYNLYNELNATNSRQERELTDKYRVDINYEAMLKWDTERGSSLFANKDVKIYFCNLILLKGYDFKFRQLNQIETNNYNETEYTSLVQTYFKTEIDAVYTSKGFVPREIFTFSAKVLSWTIKRP